MFKKLHRQMTIFSALITSEILILMAIASLVIFERGLTRNSYERFLNNGNSCVAYLETQSVLSHKWILEAKQEYGVELRILNNGKRLFFDKLNEESSSNASGENGRKSSVENMLAEAARISREEQGLDVEYTGSISLPKEVYFETADFYACTALIPKGSGVLSLVLVYPLDGLKGQIFHQRILWGGLLLIAVLALVVFSWFFTGKMLRPLEENRKRQTQFIASASHELRSPLAVILSSVQAIEADPGECRRFLSTIKSEGTRMSRLIGDMLALANADNKSWSIMKSPCELDTLLLETYEKYEPLLREKGISMNVELPDESLSRADAMADGSVRFWEFFWIMVPAMFLLAEKSGLAWKKRKNILEFMWRIMDRGFRMRIRKQCSRDFTGQIPPGRISSILDLGFALQRRS